MKLRVNLPGLGVVVVNVVGAAVVVVVTVVVVEVVVVGQPDIIYINQCSYITIYFNILIYYIDIVNDNIQFIDFHNITYVPDLIPVH